MTTQEQEDVEGAAANEADLQLQEDLEGAENAEAYAEAYTMTKKD
jgi:hypothetical protein